ncbi:MAG: glutamine synthetase [Gammaproteobacteria bacterium]|nr:glutamine synthetase [Gammaproteobacteria bacterium]
MRELFDWLKQNKITEVECLIPDMTGNARGKIIPASKFCDDNGMRLPESIFVQTVTGDWPDDMSMIDPREIDMILKPDISTARLVPWASEPTALIIHDCFDQEDMPIPISPRNVLRRMLLLYKARGWEPIVAPELEFYLVKANTDPDYPLEPPIGRSGRAETARQSYSIDAVNEFDPLFEDIYDYAEAQQLEVDTLIHESGAAQMEFNFQHGDAMSLADQVFVFKRTVREAAMRHNIYATFMAKPMQREPGSAMHLHMSVRDEEGMNIFAGTREKPNPLFMHFIAGMQKYMPAAMLFLAPNINSYRRIARDEAAPINMQWGYDNRTAGLRVPVCDEKNTRIENRVAGVDANPYIAFAATLACGYLGIEQKLQPTPPLEDTAYDLPYGLPRSPELAVSLLRNCPELVELMGERFVDAYIAVKEKEYETYFAVISSWEREFLLLNV